MVSKERQPLPPSRPPGARPAAPTRARAARAQVGRAPRVIRSLGDMAGFDDPASPAALLKACARARAAPRPEAPAPPGGTRLGVPPHPPKAGGGAPGLRAANNPPSSPGVARTPPAGHMRHGGGARPPCFQGGGFKQAHGAAARALAPPPPPSLLLPLPMSLLYTPSVDNSLQAPRTDRTHLVPSPVLIGHAASHLRPASSSAASWTWLPARPRSPNSSPAGLWAQVPPCPAWCHQSRWPPAVPAPRPRATVARRGLWQYKAAHSRGGAGLHVQSWSNLPKGSGLGTSPHPPPYCCPYPCPYCTLTPSHPSRHFLHSLRCRPRRHDTRRGAGARRRPARPARPGPRARGPAPQPRASLAARLTEE